MNQDFLDTVILNTTSCLPQTEDLKITTGSNIDYNAFTDIELAERSFMDKIREASEKLSAENYFHMHPLPEPTEFQKRLLSKMVTDLFKKSCDKVYEGAANTGEGFIQGQIGVFTIVVRLRSEWVEWWVEDCTFSSSRKFTIKGKEPAGAFLFSQTFGGVKSLKEVTACVKAFWSMKEEPK